MNDIIVESVDATAVDVPMKRPLVTGGGTVDSAPLVLIRLKAGDIEGASRSTSSPVWPPWCPNPVST